MPVGGEPAAISNFFFTTRVSFLDIFHCTNFETTDTFFLDLNTAEKTAFKVELVSTRTLEKFGSIWRRNFSSTEQLSGHKIG